MPALNSPLNDTVEVHALGVAPPSKRRIWSEPELTSHSLLVLTPERLYLASLGSDPRPETIASISAGGDVDELLGPLATTVDLEGVHRVNLDLLNNSLAVDYFGRENTTRRATVTFSDHETADACFTKLWRRLGDGMKLNDYQRDKARAGTSPLDAPVHKSDRHGRAGAPS